METSGNQSALVKKLAKACSFHPCSCNQYNGSSQSTGFLLDNTRSIFLCTQFSCSCILSCALDPCPRAHHPVARRKTSELPNKLVETKQTICNRNMKPINYQGTWEIIISQKAPQILTTLLSLLPASIFGRNAIGFFERAASIACPLSLSCSPLFIQSTQAQLSQ